MYKYLYGYFWFMHLYIHETICTFIFFSWNHLSVHIMIVFIVSKLYRKLDFDNRNALLISLVRPRYFYFILFSLWKTMYGMFLIHWLTRWQIFEVLYCKMLILIRICSTRPHCTALSSFFYSILCRSLFFCKKERSLRIIRSILPIYQS